MTRFLGSQLRALQISGWTLIAELFAQVIFDPRERWFGWWCVALAVWSAWLAIILAIVVTRARR